MKDTEIRFRCNSDFKKDLNKAAQKENRTLTSYIEHSLNQRLDNNDSVNQIFTSLRKLDDIYFFICRNNDLNNQWVLYAAQKNKNNFSVGADFPLKKLSMNDFVSVLNYCANNNIDIEVKTKEFFSKPI